MELEWNHVYHPAPFPLTDIQAVFTEGITCILGDDLKESSCSFNSQPRSRLRYRHAGERLHRSYQLRRTVPILSAGDHAVSVSYPHIFDAAPLRPRSHLQVRRASVGIRLPGASLRSHRRASPVCPQAHPASADALLRSPGSDSQ